MIEKNRPQEIEIEIVNPEDVEVTIGDTTIDVMPEDTGYNHDENLAEMLDDQSLQALSSDLLGFIEEDKRSRCQWEDILKEGIDVVGLDIEERSEPWEGACGLKHPLLIEAAVRFQSETIMEVFPPQGPVETKIIGKETPEKIDAAKRVKEDMNYELTEKMPEFRDEFERLLFNLALQGCGFKKVQFDSSRKRQVSYFVPAEDVILPMGVSFDMHRITHVMYKTKNEIRKLQTSGFFRSVKLQAPTIEMDDVSEEKQRLSGVEAVTDDRYKLYEIQCELIIADNKNYVPSNTEESEELEEGDVEVDLSEEDEKPASKYIYEPEKREVDPEVDIALPYVVIMGSCGTILAIRRNWREDDDTYEKINYFVKYDFVPGFGPYGFGLIHLVGSFAKGSTSILRQLIDAGTLSNLPGGLKTRGVRVTAEDTPIAPGEFRDIEVASGTIKDNILPLPYKEPSQVLLALYNNVVDEGRRLAATADLKISDMSAEAPVGTTLALLERQLKVMSAVQARVHNSFKQELKLIKNIIRDHASGVYEYTPDTEDPTQKQMDYDSVDVIPVSNPSASTMTQRIAQLQSLIQLSTTAPEVYNKAFLHRSAIDMLGIPNADKLVPLPDDKTRTPKDPARENMAAVIGEPLKAFSYQDHAAHMAAHQAFLQDPTNAAMLQSPTGQGIAPALMAHIQEHQAMLYRQQIEQLLGTQLPEGDAPVPPELERQLSAMIAQAGQALLQKNVAQAQQAMQQQQLQDPELRLREKELNLKEMKEIREARNDAMDFEEAMRRFDLDREKLQFEASKEGARAPLDQAKQIQELRARAAKTAESMAKTNQILQQRFESSNQQPNE